MRILHTSDWHLGTWLDTRDKSRLPEQITFIDELCRICEDEKIELVIIAGDIFDTYVPPAEAEALFYDAMERLCDGGKRCIVAIAGNHDDPQRLTAANPILLKHGVIIIGTPNECACDFENDFISVKSLQKCCFEVHIKKSGETAVVAAMPYPSEKRLNERLTCDDDTFDEATLQKNYSEKVGELLGEMAAFFRDETVNIITGHFYVAGGQTSAGIERDVSIGGGFAVSPDAIPKNADYIALGHLHRAQAVAGTDGRGFYSGSPIAYSLSEINFSKCVYIVDVGCKERPAIVNKQLLSCPKPIEEWKFNSIEEAIEFCEKNGERNCFAYITIYSDRPLYQNEIKAMNQAKKDIIFKDIISLSEEEKNKNLSAEVEEKSIGEEFVDFYKSERGTEPPEEILRLFGEILNFSAEEGDSE